MLQLSNDQYSPGEEYRYPNVNIHVAFPTTPSQIFHLLRRQLKRNFRKPLVVAAPKALLRLPAASSSFVDLLPGTRFHPVLTDPIASPELVERIVFLSGKIYYDLVKQRQSLGLNDRVAFLRIEELSPFPFHQLRHILQTYTSAKQFLWLQEEPRNQGAWAHVACRLNTVLAGLGRDADVVYNGRKEASLPAPGAAGVYAVQQKDILAAAFQDL